MANALGPYFVQINYHYILGPHTMTLPTREWSPDGGAGTFLNWVDFAIAGDTMVEGLVTDMLPFFDANTTFDNWTVFEQLDNDDLPTPLHSEVFSGMVGSNAGGSWSAAVETIITARTTDFGLAKLTLLDSISGDDFNPILTLAGALATLVGEWTITSNGWSGRDNARPNTFLKATLNLNDKLRKSYRLN